MEDNNSEISKAKELIFNLRKMELVGTDSTEDIKQKLSKAKKAYAKLYAMTKNNNNNIDTTDGDLGIEGGINR